MYEGARRGFSGSEVGTEEHRSKEITEEGRSRKKADHGIIRGAAYRLGFGLRPGMFVEV